MEHKNQLFPWYDSNWLYSYVVCKQFISAHYPARLAEFVAAFEILRVRTDFQNKEIGDLFSADELEQMKLRIAEIEQSEYEKYEFFEFGRIIKHDDPLFMDFQKKLIDRVSEYTGEELEISYNFLSLYNNLGVLNPHMDGAPAKWTVDFCIDQSAVWPIYLSKTIPWQEEFRISENWMEEIKNDKSNEFKKYELTSGKAVLFAGSSQWHYRERIPVLSKNNFCHLIFFHFIPKGSHELCNTTNWSRLFGIPELAELIIAD